MPNRLKRRIARLFKRLVRQRHIKLLASPPTLAVAKSAEAISPKIKQEQSAPPLQPFATLPSPLNFIGLGLVYTDLSDSSIADAAGDLRVGISLVAHSSLKSACGDDSQKLLLQDEIRVPLRACIDDSRLTCNIGADGSGDGPLYEATVQSQLLSAKKAAHADADLAKTSGRFVGSMY